MLLNRKLQGTVIQVRYVYTSIIFFFRFLNGFLDECNRVLSAKLAFTKQSTDEIEEKIEKIAQELGKLDCTRNEVTKESYKF